jgi:hypothetical protein
MHRQRIECCARASLVVCLLAAGVASAVPLVDPGGDSPVVDRTLTCIENATTSLTAEPASVELYATKPVHLAWSIRMPAGCTSINRFTLAGQAVGLTGSLDVQPPLTTGTYRLTASVPTGTATLATVTVAVSIPDNLSVISINGSTAAWRALLIQALGRKNTTVNLAANVDMDMSNLSDIQIAEGVTLTSESSPPDALSSARVVAASSAGGTLSSPPIPNRDARQLGPRLYTRTNLGRGNLFTIAGPNVRLRNFRLEGPQYDIAEGDNQFERGVYVVYKAGIEISNMEFSGWGGTGIYVMKQENVIDHTTRPFENVWIHDNFFHHNQHIGGDGYGIEVKHNAHALIERNVFDFNRHAISAGGEYGTGYIARRNLVLKGGGVQGYGFHTQQFDVHGTETCAGVDQGCGQAGEYFEMTDNAFQYTNGYAVKVRGNPTVGAVVSRNVFAHGSQSDAIAQTGASTGVISGDDITNPIQALGNTFGQDGYGKYGVCDFDGDGKDDLFLATGASWWYLSGGSMQWVFLNASTERLDQLGLGDFDGDGRCDVFSINASDFGIYKSGTGAWQSLGTYPGVRMSELRFADFNGDGITDVFRRAPDGQWWIVSPGHYPWTAIQSSALPLAQLRFGDFNGDRVTDVVALVNGHWSVSWGGREAWLPLNPLESSSLANVLIADLDGNGVADIVRFSRTGPVDGRWEVSWDGRTGWQSLGALDWPAALQTAAPSSSIRGYVGRFTGATHADLLSVDFTRFSKILDRAGSRLVDYGRYAY